MGTTSSCHTPAVADHDAQITVSDLAAASPTGTSRPDPRRRRQNDRMMTLVISTSRRHSEHDLTDCPNLTGFAHGGRMLIRLARRAQPTMDDKRIQAGSPQRNRTDRRKMPTFVQAVRPILHEARVPGSAAPENKTTVIGNHGPAGRQGV